jgi:putative transcriptional regulator
MNSSHVHDEPQGREDMPAGTETDWAFLEAMTGEEAHQAALEDPDLPPLTADQLARLRSMPDPQKIRKSLRLTQRQFSRQFEIALGTLRDWEQGARRPDSAARAYLRVINHNPNAVREALRTDTGEQPVSLSNVVHILPVASPPEELALFNYQRKPAPNRSWHARFRLKGISSRESTPLDENLIHLARGR